MWAFLAPSTVVYAYTRVDRSEHSVVFWDTARGETIVKFVKRLLSVHAAGDHCVLVTSVEKEAEQADERETATVAAKKDQEFLLILCNAIGSPLDSRYLPFDPESVAATGTHVIAASGERLFVWRYRERASDVVVPSDGNRAEGDGSPSTNAREQMFDMGTSTTANSAEQRDSGRPGGASMCCVAASATCLLVGRTSGVVQRYSLPSVTFEQSFLLLSAPTQLSLNCSSQR